MNGTRSVALLVSLCTLLAGGIFDPAASQAKPEGEMRWALYVTLSPVWFDPGEVVGVLTPFWVLYALHDALVKPMPGNQLDPEPGRVLDGERGSADLRVQAARGAEVPQRRPLHGRGREVQLPARQGAKLLHEKVREVTIVDPYRVRFRPARALARLHDLLRHVRDRAPAGSCPRSTSSRSATTASRRHPIGLGPYKFVSNTPGVELVMEAYEGYWRKVPSVKRLVYKSVPEATTRMAMLKRGEVDSRTSWTPRRRRR